MADVPAPAQEEAFGHHGAAPTGLFLPGPDHGEPLPVRVPAAGDQKVAARRGAHQAHPLGGQGEFGHHLPLGQVQGQQTASRRPVVQDKKPGLRRKGFLRSGTGAWAQPGRRARKSRTKAIGLGRTASPPGKDIDTSFSLSQDDRLPIAQIPCRHFRREEARAPSQALAWPKPAPGPGASCASLLGPAGCAKSLSPLGPGEALGLPLAKGPGWPPPGKPGSRAPPGNGGNGPG